MQSVDQDENVTDASARRVAITGLYQKYAPTLLVYLRHHTLSVEDAEDVLLDVFAAALGQKRLLTLPEPAQRMWLWRVAKNKLVDAYRRRGQHSTLSLEDETMVLLMDGDSVPEQMLIRQEEYTDLHLAVRGLSPLQREVVRLRFGQNLRCGEIGLLLGKSEKAIRSMLARTLNHLRGIVPDREEEQRP